MIRIIVLKINILLLVCLMEPGGINAQGSIQNIESRSVISLNGRWNYIIDSYEMGYYDYRHEPFDQSPSEQGGFYNNITQAGPMERVEYNFDLDQTLMVPGDWNSQYEKLSF